MGCSSSKDAVQLRAVQGGVVERKNSTKDLPGNIRTFDTRGGKWLTSPESFIFTFIHKDWDEDVKKAVSKAHHDALAMLVTIKKAVKATSGLHVNGGLYVGDATAMINALNSIDGVAQTFAETKNKNGSSTVSQMNQEFFAIMLASLTADVEPLAVMLTESMATEVQTKAKHAHSDKHRGMIIGIVSAELYDPVITFKYVYVSKEVSDWFVSVTCASSTRMTYDYNYTAVDFAYVKP